MVREIAATFGKVQLSEQMQAILPARRLRQDLFDQIARPGNIASDLHRLRLTEPEIRIARIDAQRAIEACRRVFFAPLQRDARPAVERARMIRFESKATIVGPTGLRNRPCRPFRIGADRPIARGPLASAFEFAQMSNGIARPFESRQRDRAIDGEIGIIRRKRQSGGEARLRQGIIAEPLRERSGIVQKRGVLRICCESTVHLRKRHFPVSGALGGKRAFDPLSGWQIAHLSRNHPVIAYRPTGAKGGT